MLLRSQRYCLKISSVIGLIFRKNIHFQFRSDLAGRPVLMHTIERFKSFNDAIEIITVLPENQLRYWIDLQKKHSFSILHTLVKGGSNRFFSVRNGLKFVNSPGLVAIHDGVR